MGALQHNLRRRSFGASLIELMVAISVTSIIVIGAFLVMNEGLQLFRTNKRAADAQVDVLQVLTRVTTEAVNAKVTPSEKLVRAYPEDGPGLNGIVFASPLLPDGNARIDPVTAEIYWQKLICYYYVPGAGGEFGKIHRAEVPIPPNPAAIPAEIGPGSKDVDYVETQWLDVCDTNYFQVSPGVDRRLLGHDISGFTVQKYAGSVGGAAGVVHTAYDVVVEAGDKNNLSSTGYYLKVDSRVTPRG